MNKLSFLVVVIFLLLGALLWGLANVSMQAYIKSQISNLSPEITGYQLNVETVEINVPTTTLNNLILSDDDKHLLTIEKITIVIDPESLKHDEIEVTDITIHAANNVGLTLALKQQILTNITRYLTQGSAPKTQPDHHFHFPEITFKKANFKNEYHVESAQELTFQSQPADKAFAQLFKIIINNTK